MIETEQLLFIHSLRIKNVVPHLKNSQCPNRAASKMDVSSLIYKVVTSQSPVGTYGADGSVYSCGGQKYLNVIIGSNGYVVSAHNVSGHIQDIQFY